MRLSEAGIDTSSVACVGCRMRARQPPTGRHTHSRPRVSIHAARSPKGYPMKHLLAIALLLFAPLATAADITSTRDTAYDWQAQKADGSAISNHARFDTAFVACLNNPACAFVQGGRYRITRGTVTPPPVLGSAALSWTAPTKNTDGSSLTDLAGYRVYHGISPTALTDMVQLSAATLSHTYGQLAPGTHYFAIAAYNTSGVESALTGIGSKVVP